MLTDNILLSNNRVKYLNTESSEKLIYMIHWILPCRNMVKEVSKGICYNMICSFHCRILKAVFLCFIYRLILDTGF